VADHRLPDMHEVERDGIPPAVARSPAARVLCLLAQLAQRN